MAANPYDDAPAEDWVEQPPQAGQRVSLLAVFSLLSSLACCVPLSGVLGMGLGGSAILAIGSSQGRLTGKPAAVIGLILGLMVTAIQGALCVGAITGWNFYVHRMAPAAAAFVEAAHNRDAAALRPMLAGPAQTDLTDEQLFAFGERITRAFGQPRGAPTRFSVIASSLIKSFSTTRGRAQQRGGVTFSGDVVPVPIVLSFAVDETTAWAFFDDNSLKHRPQRAKVVDMLVRLPDGSYAALLAHGSAKNLADQFGYTISFTAEEFSPAAAPASPE